MNIKRVIFVFLVIVLLLSVQMVLAQTANGKIDRETAKQAISQAEKDIKDMQNVNFSVVQVNDILIIAKSLFETQRQLENTTGSADYSEIVTKTDEIADIKKKSFEVYDELSALKVKLDEISSQQDIKDAAEIFSQAESEFKDGRFNQARVLIDDGYIKISELQAVTTKLVAIYEASTETLGGFVQRNYKILIAILAIIAILYLSFKRRIIIHLLYRQREKLELEKRILNDLVKKSQYEYFEKGILSEGSYSVRISKFGELIRDIDRRLSLLNLKVEETLSKKRGVKESLKNIGHKVGLYKTPQEKEEIEKRKGEIGRIEKEKAAKIEAEKRAKEAKKSEEQRRKEQEKRAAELKKKQEKEERGRIKAEKAREVKKVAVVERGKEIKKRKNVMFSIFHSIGLAKTPEEKARDEAKKRLKLLRKKLEKEVKEKRIREEQQKKTRIKVEERRRKEEEVQRKEQERKSAELRKKQGEPGKGQKEERKNAEKEKKEAENRRKEAEKRNAELRKKQEIGKAKAEREKARVQKKAEKKRIKAEKARKRKKLMFNFLHDLGLAKTAAEKAEIAQRKKQEALKIAAEKRRKEQERMAREAKKREEQRKKEAEKRNAELRKKQEEVRRKAGEQRKKAEEQEQEKKRRELEKRKKFLEQKKKELEKKMAETEEHHKKAIEKQKKEQEEERRKAGEQRKKAEQEAKRLFEAGKKQEGQRKREQERRIRKAKKREEQRKKEAENAKIKAEKAAKRAEARKKRREKIKLFFKSLGFGSGKKKAKGK